MEENNVKKRKHRLLLLLMIFVLLLAVPGRSARAANDSISTGGSGTGDDMGQSTTTVVGGPKSTHTGWLVYIVDGKKNQISETKVFYSSSERPPSNCQTYEITKFGKSFSFRQDDGEAEWGEPFTTGGAGRGATVKSYMLSNDQVLTVIYKYFADDLGGAETAAQTFAENDYYLILEPFYWGQAYNGTKATGIWVLETAEGWAYWQQAHGLGAYGSALINRYTNGVYPHCCKLEGTMWDFTPIAGNKKLSNSQIIGSGNGLIAIWADKQTDIRPEDTIPDDSRDLLYSIRNWSDEFDISRSIPSGEEVDNFFTADSFYGRFSKGTKVTDSTKYSATYTYTWEEPRTRTVTHTKTEWDETKKTNVTKTYTTTETYYVTLSLNQSLSFLARTSYEYIDRIQIYALDDFIVNNDSFPNGRVVYEKTNSALASEFHFPQVTPDVVEYRADNVYAGHTADTGIIQVPESHYYLPPSSFIENKEIHVGSRSEAVEQFQKDRAAAEQSVYDASWSRNDRFKVKVNDNGTEVDYVFMDSELVKGCEIVGGTGTVTASSAASLSSPYRYGAAGLELTTAFRPAQASGIKRMVIPENTDNKDYPTSIETHYKNVVNSVNTYNTVFHSGKSRYDDADSIYDHLYGKSLDSGEVTPTQHDGGDPSDGYPVRVHTPVIAPIEVVDYLSMKQENPDAQLIDVDKKAAFQLKLDETYFVRWNGDMWLSAIYGDEPGYGYSEENPSKYDQYVMEKQLKFPFDVYYDGSFYEADTWITLQEPEDWTDNFRDGVEVHEYESNNHWTMTPFYIPSYAEEGSGTIEARVYAYNTYGRFDGVHSSDMEYEQNAEQKNYVATYAVTDQLSGVLYGFSVVGVGDTDMYNHISLTKSHWDWEYYSLAKVKEEKIVGHNDPDDPSRNTFNRFGNGVYRYLTDGTLTYAMNDFNFLPIRNGSNWNAGTHSGDGNLWLGEQFAYEVKSIANLWGDNDYIVITPSFTFVGQDENGNKKLLTYPSRFYDNDGDGFITTKDDENLRPGQKPNTGRSDKDINQEDLVIVFKNQEREGSIVGGVKDKAEVEYTTQLSNRMFEESYYNEEDTLYQDGIPVRYGDWLNYTVDRHNTTHRLTGVNAVSTFEFTDLKHTTGSVQQIKLDRNVRMLSGEWDQLRENETNDKGSLVTYYDFNRDGSRDGGIGDDLEYAFRDSMQTWFGMYLMPGSTYLYDNSNHDFFDQTALDHEDYLKEGELIINFDIVAYKDGKPHLAYGGKMNGGIEWTKEGFGTNPPQLIDPRQPERPIEPDDFKEEPGRNPVDPDGPYKPGDVMTYDTDARYSDKFTTKDWVIN